MRKKKKTDDPRVHVSVFPLQSFIISFIVLGLLTTGQMLILQNYVDYSELPTKYTVAIFSYWILVAVAFTLFTKSQFNRHYQNPMEEFAQATRKVAGGDFSVYVAPRHLPEKMDYMDAIIMDFNVMVEALGSIETLKTDFFSNVSHEIKTPLSIIANYAQGLKDGNLSEVQKEVYIETILDSSTRLAELISNILKLNKLEKQTLQPITEPYDVWSKRFIESHKAQQSVAAEIPEQLDNSTVTYNIGHIEYHIHESSERLENHIDESNERMQNTIGKIAIEEIPKTQQYLEENFAPLSAQAIDNHIQRSGAWLGNHITNSNNDLQNTIEKSTSAMIPEVQQRTIQVPLPSSMINEHIKQSTERLENHLKWSQGLLETWMLSH